MATAGPSSRSFLQNLEERVTKESGIRKEALRKHVRVSFQDLARSSCNLIGPFCSEPWALREGCSMAIDSTAVRCTCIRLVQCVNHIHITVQTHSTVHFEDFQALARSERHPQVIARRIVTSG